MSTEHVAIVEVAAPRAELGALSQWFDTDPDVVPDTDESTTTRMRLHGESHDRLASMLAMLAISYGIEIVEAPAEVHELLALTARRLVSGS